MAMKDNEHSGLINVLYNRTTTKLPFTLTNKGRVTTQFTI